MNLLAIFDISPIPRSIAQAMYDPNWKLAMAIEMSALYFNHTWDLVPHPPTANIYQNKFDSHGNLDRYKGRLIAQGFFQQPSLHFDDTFNSCQTCNH